MLSAYGTPAALVPIFVVATVIGGGWGLLAVLPFAIARATRVAALWLLGAIVAQSAVVAALKALIRRAAVRRARVVRAHRRRAAGATRSRAGTRRARSRSAAFIAVRAPALRRARLRVGGAGGLGRAASSASTT